MYVWLSVCLYVCICVYMCVYVYMYIYCMYYVMCIQWYPSGCAQDLHCHLMPFTGTSVDWTEAAFSCIKHSAKRLDELEPTDIGAKNRSKMMIFLKQEIWWLPRINLRYWFWNYWSPNKMEGFISWPFPIHFSSCIMRFFQVKWRHLLIFETCRGQPGQPGSSRQSRMNQTQARAAPSKPEIMNRSLLMLKPSCKGIWIAEKA